MSGCLLILIVAAVIYYDAGWLENRDSLAYRRVLGFAPGTWALLNLLLFALVGVAYLLRRRDLLRRLATDEEVFRPPTERFQIRTELTGVFLLWILITVWLGLAGAGLFLVRDSLDLPIGSEVGFVTAVGLLSNLAFLVIAAVHFRAAPRRPFWRSLGWFGPVRWLRWVVLPALLGLAMALGVGALTRMFGSGAEAPIDRLLESATTLDRALFVLTAVLAAPFFEELVFRGYLYSALERLRGTVPAVVMVAVLFGLLHVEQLWGTWLAVAGIFVIGLALTVLRARSGSVIPSTVAHFSYNTALVLLLPLVLLFMQSPALLELQLRGDDLATAEREELILRVLEESSDDPVALNNLAWDLAEEGRNLERAIELVDRALAISPDEPAYLDTRAEVLFAMGEIAAAIAIEERLVTRHPEHAFYREQLERFRAALNDRERDR